MPVPAEEDVAGRLHQPLALDDALAVVGVAARARGTARAPRPAASLICRNSGSFSSRPEQQHDPAARADAADADDLAGDVDELGTPRAGGGDRPGASAGSSRRTDRTSSLDARRRSATPSTSSSIGTMSGGSETIRGSPSTRCVSFVNARMLSLVSRLRGRLARARRPAWSSRSVRSFVDELRRR